MRLACCVLILLFQPSFVGLRSCLWTQDLPQAYKVMDSVTFDKLLDLVFQGDEANRHYDFSLRFKPSNAPELQIYIKQTGTKTQVVEYTSRSGNIFMKLDKILENGGKEDVVEMARQIQVNKRILDVPLAQANQWWMGLPDAIAATIKLLEQRRAEAAKGVGVIVLDGTHYSFTYQQGISDIIVDIIDNEISCREVTGEAELVQWMNRVRCDVEKLK